MKSQNFIKKHTIIPLVLLMVGLFSIQCDDTGSTGRKEEPPPGPVGTTATLPAPNMNLAVGNEEMTISWDSVEGAVSYNVYRDDVLIAEGITETSYTDTNLTNGHTYTYQVAAVDAQGKEGDKSANSSGIPVPEEPGDVGIPQNVSANSGVSMVTLRWEAPDSEGSYIYKIYRDGVLHTVVNSGMTTYTDDMGLTSGVAYNYQVSAVFLIGEGNCPDECVEGTRSNSVSISLELPGIIIAEFGNGARNRKQNDYLVLYNKTDSAISLNGMYIFRDHTCRLGEYAAEPAADGWQANVALPDENVPPNSYYLVIAPGNTNITNFNFKPDSDGFGGIFGSGKAGSIDYCIAITNSSTPPASASDSNVIDFIAFGDCMVNGTGSNAPENRTLTGCTPGEGNSLVKSDDVLEGEGYRRKGTCSEQDTNVNSDDFLSIDVSDTGYAPRNSMTQACVP